MKTLHLSIIAILVLVISSASTVYAQSSSIVSVSLAKVSVGLFNMTETSPTIVISGIVYKAFSQNIVLTIFNPQNQLISVSQLQPRLDGSFSKSIIPSNPLWPKGNYTVRMTSGSQNLTESVFYFPGIGCCKRIIIPGVQGQISNSTNSLSPLKQFKSGIAANNVKCEQGLQLVIKAKDNSPACVKLDSAYMLIKRGWATSESAYPGGDARFALDTNSTIIPAHLPRSSGLRIPYYESSQVTNYSGFDGVYNETLPYRGTQKDYVLKPGSTGVIVFKIDAMASEQQGQDYPIPLPKSLNLTNYAVFYHEITSLEDLSKYPGVTFNGEGYGDFRACSIGPAGGGACIGGPFAGTNPIEAFVTDHPGVDILFEPPSEVSPLGMNATSQVVTITITVDSNAPRGTYLAILPSSGLDSFLLTVGNQPYHE